MTVNTAQCYYDKAFGEVLRRIHAGNVSTVGIVLMR